VLSIVWFGLAVAACRGYRDGVLAQVTARPWEPSDLVESDAEAVDALLRSDDPRDVVVALAAVRPGGARAGVELTPLLEAADPYVRLAAVCRVVRAGGPSARDAEVRWLQAVSGGDAVLKDAALAGCAAAPASFFVGPVLAEVTRNSGGAALSDAVRAHAVELAPRLVARLSDTQGREERHYLVRALGWVRDVLDESPNGLPPLTAELDAGVARVVRALRASEALRDAAGVGLLRRALVEDVTSTGDAVAEVLSMYHGRRRVEGVVAGLGATGGGAHALTLEVLEVLEGRQAGARLAAVLSPDLEPRDRLGALGDPDLGDRSAADWVTELVADPGDRWSDAWLRTCALHAAAAVLGPAAGVLVRPWMDDPDPVVAETARAALSAAEMGGSGAPASP
jgi:hypothetical protein